MRMRKTDPRVGRLSEAFTTVFGIARRFTNLEIGVVGFSDGARGTQWNSWYNVASERAFCGVNLEGIEGSGWPCSRFLERELARPMVFCALEELADSDAIDVRLWRDAWIAGKKHRSVRDELAPTPLPASRLTGDGWRKALRAAWECTDKSTHGRGFGRQDVVLRVSGKSKPATQVSPHLQFKTMLWEHEPASVAARTRALAHARRLLLPIYSFVHMRSGAVESQEPRKSIRRGVD